MPLTRTAARGTNFRGGDILVLAALVIISSLTLMNTSSVVDTARDVYYAWQIAEGRHFPMQGPYVGGVFHGGPIWYYLLSVPLVFSPSWLLMSLWVGLLAALKYGLAYACGSRLADRNLGLAWACLLALPDWTTINTLIFSHTSLVETSLLFCLLCLIRWQQGQSAGWFLALCLGIGLGIHAHPTVYAAGLLALPFVIRSVWRRELSPWMLPAGALAALLPFVPYIIHQSLNGWPDLQTGQGYFQSQPLWMNALGFGDVMGGALIDGPRVALEHVIGLRGTGLHLATAVVFLVTLGGSLLSVAAILLRKADRTPLLLGLGALACVLAVALVRHVTPFYQAFVIYPLFYGFAAWGWCWSLAGRAGILRAGLAATAVLALTAVGLATLQMGRTGHLTVPEVALMDIRTRQISDHADTVFYPGWGRGQLAEYLCSVSGPLSFHAFGALVLEQSYALEARILCDREDLMLGGRQPGRHVIGISEHSVVQLDIGGGKNLGSMRVFDVSGIIAPEQPVPVPEGREYPPRPYRADGRETAIHEFTLPSEEWLAVTNLYYYWMPFEVDVALDGRQVEPVGGSRVSSYYRCRNCRPGSSSHWSVTVTAPRPDLVEVVSFNAEQAAE
jgi:hypothetical protein